MDAAMFLLENAGVENALLAILIGAGTVLFIRENRRSAEQDLRLSNLEREYREALMPVLLECREALTENTKIIAENSRVIAQNAQLLQELLLSKEK